MVGERMWPTYAAKALGLFFLTSAVLAFLGGVVQINPIWLYGPFDPAEVSAASQPDWYMGWLDGALRIMPGWEIRAFGFEIPNPFFPGVLLAGLTFALLYAWPFLEARVTGDHDEHHLLDRPRAAPGAHRPRRGHDHLLRGLLPGRRRRRAGGHLRPVGQRHPVDVPGPGAARCRRWWAGWPTGCAGSCRPATACRRHRG